jgi:hypothetical protein
MIITTTAAMKLRMEFPPARAASVGGLVVRYPQPNATELLDTASRSRHRPCESPALQDGTKAYRATRLWDPIKREHLPMGPASYRSADGTRTYDLPREQHRCRELSRRAKGPKEFEFRQD